MTNDLFLKLQMLKDYLKNVYTNFPEDLLDDLEQQDPAYYEHIQNAEHEYARLNNLIEKERQQQQEELFPVAQPHGKSQQMMLDFGPDFVIPLPEKPKQTKKQALKATTMFTPLPSIVEEGYDKKHRGINWPHYKNMLKLFTLGYLIQGELTPQQQKDKDDLTQAIEKTGNAKYKKKHLSAEEIIERDSGVYMRYGKNVIRAMAEKDPLVSERQLKDLRSEIPDTRNDNNAIQLHKMMSHSKAIFMSMQSRYKAK